MSWQSSLPFPQDDPARDHPAVRSEGAADLAGARSLNIAINEPIPGHIVILPGKMTEAPYLTDILTSYIHNRLDNPDIALRPCDEFSGLPTDMTREVA